ncbi:MAG TPA: nitrilase-related carbon-nitrogen hydrolase [Thermomicrobiales bacterium]|nr:nitrilase-related carbon-nitrogen hydrolase [Thermomicrobiales bacterium]
MPERRLLTAFAPPPSPMARPGERRPPFRIGLVQEFWRPDPDEHQAALAAGARQAVAAGARLVCLQELTLSPYFAIAPDADEAALARAEPIPDGPTTQFAARLAAETGAWMHASLYERAADGGLGYNTAICVAPDGALLARTRKIHIPAFPGYHEDRYFRPGDTGFPAVTVGPARLGFPTCWDQWFPETARAYSLAGADVLVFPTAIGSEPARPDFDTQPIWEHVITANGVMNATFMVVVNRIGIEGPLRFYGSSFISDPYGRVLLRAPRDEPAVLVADLDLDQRRDWLGFGLFATRRPEVYGRLTEGVGGRG